MNPVLPILACMAALLLAVPAAAQEPVAGRILILVPTTHGLIARVLGLQATTRDIVARVENLGGAVKDLQVKETETEIRIELAADVLFDFDQATLRPEAREALARVAAIIKDHPKARVRIEGHTDAKGAEGYNQKLSERRARSVRDWLAQEGTLARTRFATRGLGESRPAAPNVHPDGSDNPEGRQKNRRVEIVVDKP